MHASETRLHEKVLFTTGYSFTTLIRIFPAAAFMERITTQSMIQYARRQQRDEDSSAYAAKMNQHVGTSTSC